MPSVTRTELTDLQATVRTASACVLPALAIGAVLVIYVLADGVLSSGSDGLAGIRDALALATAPALLLSAVGGLWPLVSVLRDWPRPIWIRVVIALAAMGMAFLVSAMSFPFWLMIVSDGPIV